MVNMTRYRPKWSVDKILWTMTLDKIFVTQGYSWEVIMSKGFRKNDW